MATKKKTLVEDTSAAATISPPEHEAVPFGGGDDHKSRFEKISAMISQTQGMNDEHLTKWYKEMMAWHDRAGHGVGVGDNSGANKASIEAHPSDANGKGDMDTKMAADTIDHVAPGNTLHPSLNKQNEQYSADLKAAVAEMFAEEEGLTEEFKTKATVIFETAVNAKVALKAAEMAQVHEDAVISEVEKINEALTENLDAYLDHTASRWLADNEVEIESSLRNEIMSEFAEGLRNLFIEHNFNIPEEQIEVVETLASKVEELESALNSAILENAKLIEFKEQTDKAAIVAEAVTGLTMVDAEKLNTLVESIEAEDLDSFKQKLEIVKESITKVPAKKVTLTEQLEDVDPTILEQKAKGETQVTNPEMAKYVKRIQKEIAAGV